MLIQIHQEYGIFMKQYFYIYLAATAFYAKEWLSIKKAPFRGF